MSMRTSTSEASASVSAGASANGKVWTEACFMVHDLVGMTPNNAVKEKTIGMDIKDNVE